MPAMLKRAMTVSNFGDKKKVCGTHPSLRYASAGALLAVLAPSRCRAVPLRL